MFDLTVATGSGIVKPGGLMSDAKGTMPNSSLVAHLNNVNSLNLKEIES